MVHSSSASSLSLEGTFGPGWDHQRDVLVILGHPASDFYDALRSLGQRRVVEYGDAAGVAPLPAPFVRAGTPLDLFRAVVAFPGEPPASATFRRLPGVPLSDALLADLTLALRAAVESHGVLRNTADKQSKHWVGHGLANLVALGEHPSVAALRESFRAKPCIIVSPGPSLSKNVHLLREVAGRALIMTGGHSLAALCAVQVVPDLVVVTDPVLVPRHFAGYDTTAPAALVLDVAVHPEYYGLPARRAFTFATHPTVDAWIYGPLGESALLDTGGSVACCELSLARLLGCDPIAFVGQDLALSGGQYYASSSVDGGARIEASADGRSFVLVRPEADPRSGEIELVRLPGEALTMVPGVDGGSVPTSATLYTFLQWFRIAARSGRERLYNCTEGGALIDGMEHLALREFLDRHALEPFDVGGVLDLAVAKVDTRRRRADMRESVARMASGVEASVHEARAGRGLALQALEDGEGMEALAGAEARLSEVLRELPFLSMLAQERIRAVQETGASATTLAENLQAAVDLLTIVEEAGRTTIAPLRSALEELSR